MIIEGVPDIVVCYDLYAFDEYIASTSIQRLQGENLSGGYVYLGTLGPGAVTNPNWETLCHGGYEEVEIGGGGGSSSPYIIDVGSTVMLGGLLAFMIAYWIVGLTRNKFKN